MTPGGVYCGGNLMEPIVSYNLIEIAQLSWIHFAMNIKEGSNLKIAKFEIIWKLSFYMGSIPL